MFDNPSIPIAYIVQQYPNLTNTFIYREVLALRTRGIPVQTFSIWRPHLDELSAEARQLVEETFYIFPLHSLRFIEAHVHYLLTRPRHYLGTLYFVLTRPNQRWRDRLRSLAHFGEGIYLAREIERRGIGHLHAHFIRSAASVAFIISRLLSIPYSITVHTGIYTERALIEEKIHAARFVITCTYYAKQYIKQLYGDVCSTRIIGIHHGIDLSRFKPPASSAFFLAGERDHTILAVGQLQERKGMHYLIEACHLLRQTGCQFTCSIVGEGPLRPQLESLIKRLQLEDVIHLHGAIPQEKLIDLYSTATLFVLPCVIAGNADRDGIPNVLIEAMAMQVPVISTPVSGIPELIDDGQTGFLVQPGDAQALAAAMQTLLVDEKLRRRLAIAGRQKVLQEFDVHQNAAQLVSLFKAA